jgi:hypothetical protein
VHVPELPGACVYYPTISKLFFFAQLHNLLNQILIKMAGMQNPPSSPTQSRSKKALLVVGKWQAKL